MAGDALQTGLTAGYTGGGVLLALTMLWRFQRSFVATAAERMAKLEAERDQLERRLDVALSALREAGLPIPPDIFRDREVPE